MWIDEAGAMRRRPRGVQPLARRLARPDPDSAVMRPPVTAMLAAARGAPVPSTIRASSMTMRSLHGELALSRPRLGPASTGALFQIFRTGRR